MKKILIVLFLLIPTVCFARMTGGGVTTSNVMIQEEDGSPSGKLNKLRVTNDSLTKNAEGDYSLDTGAGGSGVPTNADYLVGTANGDLSAEIVVGTTPGGELGGTWASPTIDDGVAVSNWNLTTPTITTSLTTDGKTISEAEIGVLDGGIEGTEIKSTGEAGGTKYLREDGDGTCSWQTPAASHDPVTLDANADTILSLSTQEFGLDTQAANKIFGGPAAGAAAVPTFRALVDDDIPNDITITETDPNALLTAGTDNVKDIHIDWGTGAGQVNPADFVDQDIGDITITTGAWAVENDSHDHSAAGSTVTINAADITDKNAGTDITADLEEETHASEHAVSGADTVFPADPNADKLIWWDDDPGNLSFGAITSALLYGQLSDETGSASGTPLAVFNQNPTINGATLTDVIDAGGATSTEIVNGANPTCDAAGEIAINTTDKTLELHNGTAQVSIPTIHIAQGTFDLKAQYAVATDLWLIDLNADSYPHGIYITKVYLDSTVADPTTEIDANLMYCDAVANGAFPGANATLIKAIDTTTGNFADAAVNTAVATGKTIYIDMDADPTDNDVQYHLRIHYYIPTS